MARSQASARALAAVVCAGLLAACATQRPPRPVPESHSLFPGTRVSLAVPPGFRFDPDLPAFESPDELTAIFVNEVPGSVYTTLRSFSGEAFQKSGMRLLEQEKVTVDAWPGRLYRTSQPVRDTELLRWVVVFGDGESSVVLTAVTPEPLWELISAPLRDILLSARWHREGLPPEPAGAAP